MALQEEGPDVSCYLRVRPADAAHVAECARAGGGRLLLFDGNVAPIQREVLLLDVCKGAGKRRPVDRGPHGGGGIRVALVERRLIASDEPLDRFMILV
jgi:hypothetical protein